MNQYVKYSRSRESKTSNFKNSNLNFKGSNRYWHDSSFSLFYLYGLFQKGFWFCCSSQPLKNNGVSINAYPCSRSFSDCVCRPAAADPPPKSCRILQYDTRMYGYRESQFCLWQKKWYMQNWYWCISVSIKTINNFD